MQQISYLISFFAVELDDLSAIIWCLEEWSYVELYSLSFLCDLLFLTLLTGTKLQKRCFSTVNVESYSCVPPGTKFIVLLNYHMMW